MKRSNYKIEREGIDSLTIRDIGPWDKYLTVTNNAEQVVSELVQSGLISNGIKLYYYDSEGGLDELCHDNGMFTGFSTGTRRGSSSFG